MAVNGHFFFEVHKSTSIHHKSASIHHKSAPHGSVLFIKAFWSERQISIFKTLWSQI